MSLARRAAAPGLALALLCCARTPAADAARTQPAQAPGSSLPHGTVRLETQRGPWVVAVEIARTEEDRQRGLMFRRELGGDAGMLFVFQETSEHAFWMHNTDLSLDMIFLGDDRAVVGVYPQAEPHTDAPRSVHKPSRYVLEVLGGEAGAHAVGPGTRATFIDVQE